MANLLSRVFENQSVTVAERHIPEGADNLICLIENGEVIATSPFWPLAQSFLMVNSDRYRTGTQQSNIGNFPDVLTGLDEVEFTVCGFPQSNKEKLLSVLISRFIEYRALESEAGTFHATFQRLSRLDDEYGTKQIYEWLGESDVETHVYGIRDDPTAVKDIDVTIHNGSSLAYHRSWVVLFQPPAERCTERDCDGPVALVAVEIDDNVWRGLWTYDADRVSRLKSHLTHVF
ncbi:hypothetical protein [Haloarcula sediminis]|uniref:hypothetical protein n=1 Tax=Haloarcula sediminis TaxID=3111777 RepID=UPI002D78AE3B|nr:hypothetical protein [Haloarcula sp. CK38]